MAASCIGWQAFPKEEMQVMLRKFLQLVGMSCRHRHISHPFVAASGGAPSRSHDWEAVSGDEGHYVVCLDCGKRFSYDWSAMRIVKSL